MALLANRVRAESSAISTTSVWSALDCCSALSMTARTCFSPSISAGSLTFDPYAHVPETRRSDTMPDIHGLPRLTLSAIGGAPQLPVLTIADGIAASPELRRDAGIGGVLQQRHLLTTLDFPGDLSPELKVEPAIVD